jgi:hypothetical protein
MCVKSVDYEQLLSSTGKTKTGIIGTVSVEKSLFLPFNVSKKNFLLTFKVDYSINNILYVMSHCRAAAIIQLLHC